MPIPPEAKKLLLEKGISGISDPPGRVRVYVETFEDIKKLPSFIAGYSVEPIISGRFFALQDRKAKWRPAPGGISCGHFKITAGTLSTRVFDTATRTRLILSNNHVLAASNQGSPGESIFQPGVYDGGTEADTIARLERFVQLTLGDNLMDCAVAKPLNDADLSDEILDIGVISDIEPAVVGMPVMKSGRTTGYTESTIQDVNATVKVYGYPFGHWDPEAGYYYLIFKDQIVTNFMANPGDSGSLLVNKNTKKAVGLLFAGSSLFTSHNKITSVCNLLNIEFFAPPPSPPPPVARASMPALLTAFMAAGLIPGLIRGE